MSPHIRRQHAVALPQPIRRLGPLFGMPGEAVQQDHRLPRAAEISHREANTLAIQMGPLTP